MREEPDAYPISVHTGAGIEALIAAIEGSLPRPKVEVRTLIPYNRGDLVSRIHEEGEIICEEHLENGTSLHARVDGALAHLLEKFVRV
jgi:GTP-binding protein HflX